MLPGKGHSGQRHDAGCILSAKGSARVIWTLPDCPVTIAADDRFAIRTSLGGWREW